MDKNYYMEESIDTSGVGRIYNPAFTGSNPFKQYSPVNVNVGQYFDSSSKYDEEMGDINRLIESGSSVNDFRYESQSGLEMFGNALVNHLTTAGTTAISGTLGVVEGIISAAGTGEASKLWDNNINNWALNTQEKMKEWMPVYRPDDYTNKSLWEKLGTGVFWADAFINMGFTTGMMFTGMGTGSLLAKAPKAAQKWIPSLIASFGEGSIEAVGAKNDEIRGKSEIARQEFEQQLNGLQSKAAEQYSRATSEEEKYLIEEQLKGDMNRLTQSYQNTLQDIESDAIKAGNLVLATNMALLTASNQFQWSNVFARGFNANKQIDNAIKRTVKGVTKNADGTYNMLSVGKATAKAIGSKALDATTEMGEETGQAIITKVPSLLEDYNQFNKSEFNPEKRELASNMMQGFIMATSEAMNDPMTAEAAAMGFITGFLGVPMLRKSSMPIYMENGVFQEVARARKEVNEKNKFIEEVNNRLSNDKDLNTYYQGLVRHLAMQDRMNAALDESNIFDYKTAESAQFISDIMMFDGVGDIQKLRDIINNSVDTSDEGLQFLMQETSKEGEGPFMSNGNPMPIEEVRQIINDRITTLNSKIDSYVKAKESLQQHSPTLSNEAIKNALFLDNQIKDFQERRQQVEEASYIGLRNLFNSINAIGRKKIAGKINKGEGIYVNVNGKKRLVRKDSIDHFDENGNPVFKTTEGTYTINRTSFLEDWITNPEFRATVREALFSEETTMSYADRIKLSRDLRDLEKLNHSIGVYNKHLTDILSNPGKAEELAEQNIKEAQEEYKRIGIQEVVNKINKATSPKDIDTILEMMDSQEFVEDAFKQIEDSEETEENKNTKELVSEYRNRKSLESTVNDFINSVEEDDYNKGIKNTIQSVLNNSETVKEFKDTIDLIHASTDSDSIKGVLEELKETILDKEASRKAGKKDTNKPKKKVKEKGNKKKGLDLFSDSMDDLEDGEEVEESKVESEKTIKEIEEASNNELDNIISGAKVPSNTNPEDKEKAKKLAKAIKKSRKTQKRLDDGEGTNSEDNNPKPKRKDLHLRSWTHTKYTFSDLKDRDSRKATRYDTNVSRALDALGAYDFVDEGYLGILFNRNSNIPIYYITSNNPALENRVLLAVEITKDVENLVDTSHAIEYNGKRYQVVGTLGFDKEISSAVENFNEIKKILKEEYDALETKPSYFVHSSLTNKIKHIYSGRMVKTTEEDDTISQKPLRTIVGNNPVHIGIYYDGDLHTPSLDKEIDAIVPLNSNNQNIREGSVWLMVREADGRYYAKALKVKRFTEDEYSKEENYDSDLFQTIVENVNILMNPNKSDYDRALAKYAIKDILHFPEGTDIIFNGESVSITGHMNNIGRGLEIDDAVDAFIEELQSLDLNLRFQVDVSRLENDDYRQSLIDADILTTDLALMHNINASFDLYLQDPETGELIGESKDNNPVGHTGRQGINNDISYTAVTVNGKTYSVQDKQIKLEGKIITDKKKIAEIQLQMQIDSGNINPYNGSSNLYIGTYLDGTEFGIINGKVIKGKTLENKKKTINKKSKDTSRKQKAKDDLFVPASSEAIAALNEIYEDSYEESSSKFENEEDVVDTFIEPTVVKEITAYSAKGRKLPKNGIYIAQPTDEDGFTKITFSGPFRGRFLINPKTSGLTVQEILGDREDYGSEEMYNEVEKILLEEGLPVERIVLRPNGEVYIETSEQITVEGEAAKIIYNKFFKKKTNKRTEENKENPIEDPLFVSASPEAINDLLNQLGESEDTSTSIPTSEELFGNVDTSVDSVLGPLESKKKKAPSISDTNRGESSKSASSLKRKSETFNIINVVRKTVKNPKEFMAKHKDALNRITSIEEYNKFMEQYTECLK